MDHYSRAQSSEVSAVHTVRLLRSKILTSGWKYHTPWGGTHGGSRAPARTSGQAAALAGGAKQTSVSRQPGSAGRHRRHVAVPTAAAFRDSDVWQGQFPYFSQGEHRNKITGSAVFVKAVLRLHESSLAPRTGIQLLGIPWVVSRCS